MTFFIRSVLAALPILLLLGVPARAATYYVSPLGVDSNSCAAAQNRSTPKKRIKSALACLSAAGGDTLHIREGTYTHADDRIDSTVMTIPSGVSWAAPNTVAGYPGEVVTIPPPDGFQAIKLKTNPLSYLVIQDLIIDMSLNTSVAEAILLSTPVHHIRLLRVEQKNNKGNGLLMGANFIEVLQSKFHHNGVGQPANMAYAFYVTGSSSDNLFDGNEVYANNGYGFHLYNTTGPRNVSRNILRNNKIYGNGTGGGPNFAILIAWGFDNQIYNNLIYGNRGGIQVYTGSGNAQVFNNTVYGNTPLEGIALQYYGSAPTVRNNIVYKNGAGITNHGGTGTPVTDNNLTADPKFVNAAANDFRLQSGSPAEDAGATVTAVRTDYAGVYRPQGSAYDIGAYERQKGGGPPSAPRKLKIVGP